jgi:hypothetical protein
MKKRRSRKRSTTKDSPPAIGTWLDPIPTRTLNFDANNILSHIVHIGHPGGGRIRIYYSFDRTHLRFLEYVPMEGTGYEVLSHTPNGLRRRLEAVKYFPRYVRTDTESIFGDLYEDGTPIPVRAVVELSDSTTEKPVRHNASCVSPT